MRGCVVRCKPSSQDEEKESDVVRISYVVGVTQQSDRDVRYQTDSSDMLHGAWGNC